jgi:broad specificity phosphatase PhoE
MKPTLLYLLRHGATGANLARPPRLQGRSGDQPLAPLGVLQAGAARDRLAGLPVSGCWCGPLRRPVETAAIVAAPHGLAPQPLEALTECDLGRWDGLTWDEVRRADPDAYAAFLAHPALCPHPGGESLQQVHDRVAPVLEGLLADHPGRTLLVVSHHVVLRVYLAALLGLGVGRARELSLPNGSFSVIAHEGGISRVLTLAEDGPLRHLPLG